ncbi:MAG TPA: ATP-binding cassette domain-containing protein, partial [Chloroflexota bacterium]
HHAGVLAAQLSFSEQRRLEIARALALNPRYLLLDETAAGMSEPETNGLAEDIRQLSRQGRAIMLIEHDMSLIRQVSTRVIALNFGQVLAAGSADEVLNHPAVVQAYLGG